jgi:hypothetical protein
MMSEKYDSVLSYTTVPELLFTHHTEGLFRLALLSIGGPKNACVIVEKAATLLRQCLTTTLRFRDATIQTFKLQHFAQSLPNYEAL